MPTARDLCTDECNSCRDIVVRTYRELRQHGASDRVAFQASARVLALRHPERSAREVNFLTAEWVSEPGAGSPLI